MHKSFDNQKLQRKPMVLPFVMYCIVGIFVCFLSAMIIAILISFNEKAYTAIHYVASIPVAVGSLIASFLSSRKFGKPMLTSLLQGILYFGILYLLGALTFNRIIPNDLTYRNPLFCFVGIILGAVCAAIFPKRKEIT